MATSMRGQRQNSHTDRRQDFAVKVAVPTAPRDITDGTQYVGGEPVDHDLIGGFSRCARVLGRSVQSQVSLSL